MAFIHPRKQEKVARKDESCLWIDGSKRAIRHASRVFGNGKKTATAALNAEGGLPVHPLIQN